MIRIELKQKRETIKAPSLSMGATFQTIKERDLYLVCFEQDCVVNLSTGRIESLCDFAAVIPINLVITEE